MIVCLCNAMSDGDVHDAIANGASRPKEVYACRGGRAQCGHCAPTVLQMLRQGGGQKPA